MQYDKNWFGCYTTFSTHSHVASPFLFNKNVAALIKAINWLSKIYWYVLFSSQLDINDHIHKHGLCVVP